MKRFLSVFLGLSLLMVTTACGAKPKPVLRDGPLQIVASFYPLAHFAEQMGGKWAEVTTMVPAGVDPHSYEPSPQDIVGIYEADLFVYLGAGFDPWADGLVNDLKSQGVAVLEVTDTLELLEYEEEEEDDHGDDHADEHDDDHHHGEGTTDPHVWLDPVLAIRIMELISFEMMKLDELHANDFAASRNIYMLEANAMNLSFAEELKNCEKDTVIAAHDAYGYMSERYGFHVEHISGLNADEEPSPATLARLTDVANDLGIGYILVEEVGDQKFANTIASEVGAEILVLNPLESLTPEQVANGETYLSIMRENLQSLKTALVCQ